MLEEVGQFGAIVAVAPISAGGALQHAHTVVVDGWVGMPAVSGALEPFAEAHSGSPTQMKPLWICHQYHLDMPHLSQVSSVSEPLNE